MKVVHQNLQRMTPTSKVSLEQRSSKKASPSDPFEIKKIQTSITFTKLFDITPFQEILEQHRQLQRRLVPEPCLEQTINYTMSRSKVSRVSKRSELSETSPEPRRPQSKYSKSRFKEYEDAYCLECSKREPLAFSECYESDCSDCSCSLSDEEHIRHQKNKKYLYNFDSAKKQRKVIRNNIHPSQSMKKLEDVVKRTYLKKTSIPVILKSESRHVVEKHPTEDITQQRLKSHIYGKSASSQPTKNQRPQSAKNYDPNKHKHQKDDILSMLQKPEVKTLKKRLLIEQVNIRVITQSPAASVKKPSQLEIRMAQRILLREEQRERVTSAQRQLLPTPKELKHDFNWGTDQSTVKEFKQKQQQFKSKYTEILKHVDNSRAKLIRNDKGYKSKEDINQDQKKKITLQLDQRKKMFSNKYSKEVINMSQKEKSRLENYSKERSKEREQNKQKKQKKQDNLKKLDDERSKIIHDMPKKEFHPDEEKIEQAFQILDRI